MASHRRAGRGFLAVSLCVAISTPCFRVTRAADPSAEAIALKSKADASFDSRKYADALEQYQAALAKGGDPRWHYNIAQTLTALERYPEALVSYQTFLSEAPAGTLNAAQQEKFFALLDELKSKIARIEIKCDIAGARVLVRDKVVGTTPLASPISVNAGPAKIEVLADGFKPFLANLALKGGSGQTLEAPLQRIDFTGALTVKSNVAGTQVLIDGALRGVAPITIRLERGTHLVVGRARDHVEASETATVQAGDQKDVSFTLIPAPNYRVAYLGFGIAAVGVSAGTVTGILALTHLKSAKEQCDTASKECGPTGQDNLRSSKSFGVLSTIGFGVGVAGIGIGIYGLMTARPGGSAPKTVDVMIVPGGLTLGGSF